MKKEIAEYVDKCLICKTVKAKHQHLVGELRSLDIPTWKRDLVSMDFVRVYPFQLAKRTPSGS